MQGPLRGLLAGAAAWKFGGGCVSTILIFIIVFWLLGYVNCKRQSLLIRQLFPVSVNEACLRIIGTLISMCAKKISLGLG